MPSVCFYFEVHQPMRLNRFSVFNIGQNTDSFSTYFDRKLNKEIFEKLYVYGIWETETIDQWQLCFYVCPSLYMPRKLTLLFYRYYRKR